MTAAPENSPSTSNRSASRRLTHGEVLRLAAPIILANLFTPLLGAVDTAVMGHLPDPAFIGGVAIGALVFSYVYWGFGFLRMATTGLIAQARGAANDQEIRDIAVRAAFLAVGLGAAVVLLQDPIGWVAFSILEASPNVERLADSYVSIRIWGAPATLLVYVGVGWLIGMRRMGIVLMLTAGMNGLNVGLDLLFVVGFGMGIEGVAYATLISEVSAAVAGGLVILHLHKPLSGRMRAAAAFTRDKVMALVKVNFDIFVRTLCLITGFAWFTAQGAAQGDTVLAANAILLNFLMFMAYGLDGFAHAAETLVGGAVGARDRPAFSHAVRLTTIWAMIVALVFTSVYLLLGPLLIAAQTSIPAVRETAALFLAWAIASPLVSVWSFQLDGIYIGATRTTEMRNGMILSLAALLASGYALQPLWGNHGLWLSLLVFFAVRGLTLLIWYPRLPRSLGPDPTKVRHAT